MCTTCHSAGGFNILPVRMFSLYVIFTCHIAQHLPIVLWFRRIRRQKHHCLNPSNTADFMYQ